MSSNNITFKYNKVIYIVKTDLHYYPPCMSQIRYLKACGVNVEVWFASSNNTALEIMDRENIPYCCLGESERINTKLGKIKNWLEFRKNVANKIKYEQNLDEILFWIGTAESAIPLIGLIDKYKIVLTMLELLDDKKNATKRRLFGKMAKKAEALVACEETRAYLMKYWFGLEKLPYVMPNKPYTLETTKYAEASSEKTKKAIETVRGKRIILFQGIYQKLEYMKEVALALKELNQDYYLVLMGFDLYHTNAIEILSKIYDKVIEIPSIPAPLHLEVTSHAYIGLVFYEDFSLNQAYCAPNKIFEYSGFGVPMLANKIPGLTHTVGKYNAGMCIEFKKEELINAIRNINDKYDMYEDNAYSLYNSVDNESTIRRIISDLMIETK